MNVINYECNILHLYASDGKVIVVNCIKCIYPALSVCAYAMVVHLSPESVFVLVVCVVVRFVYPLVCSSAVSFNSS